MQFTTEAIVEHMNKLLQIPGSKLLFGGKPLENHSIPSIYGALKPTAIYVPLEEMLKESNYELVTREIFGPFQVKEKIELAKFPPCLYTFFCWVFPNFILILIKDLVCLLRLYNYHD